MRDPPSVPAAPAALDSMRSSLSPSSPQLVRYQTMTHAMLRPLLDEAWIANGVLVSHQFGMFSNILYHMNTAATDASSMSPYTCSQTSAVEIAAMANTK